MNILKNTSFKTKHFSFFLLIPLILLLIIGIVTLYSTLILPTGGLDTTDIFTKQIIFLVIGILLFLLLSYLDLSYLKHWQVLLIIYAVTIILLVLTLLFGPVIKNVKRWLIIGGIQIQPSEIAKFTVIIVTSVIFSMKEKYNEWILFLLSFLFLVPILALIYLQPSGSMMVLTLSIWFLLVFMGLNNPIRNAVILTILLSTVGAFLISSITGNNLWFLLLIVAVVVGIFGFYAESNWKLFIVISFVIALLVGALSSVTWRNLLKDYQKQRIVAFINPEETSSDNLFNVNQSKIAIGSGRIFGKGFGNGTQSKRNFLPEFRTDFIFASYAEEFGLVGSLFLMLLYGLIIAFCFMTAVNCSENTMFSLISMGVGIKMLLEIFINIGTNTGSIPATGIPLPLMSAGGTITVMTLVCLGLVHNISLKNSQKLRTKKSDIIEVYED